MHSVMVALCVAFLRAHWTRPHKWLGNAVFWFANANLMELVAYLLMRGFAAHGDTGNFNRGMQISPWFLFVFGSLALLAGIYIFYRSALPRLYAAFAPDDRVLQWTILATSAFIVFLWGSGIRVIFYVYPDPQWAFGLLGIPGFILALLWFNPRRRAW